MDGELRSFEAEGAGDDVAAARQEALRALRELAGTLAEDDVEFVTVSEGDRGLMGVGRQPARVLARAQVAAVALGPVGERVRDVVERIAGAIDPELSVSVAEHGTRVIAVCFNRRARGARPRAKRPSSTKTRFNPRARVGRDAASSCAPSGKIVSIHAPASGRDPTCARQTARAPGFNPRAPCGARPARSRRGYSRVE